jgi:uncharacterized damage-inducible protein DinB
MSQTRLLSKLFEMNYEALFRNLDGITHAESLVEPKPAGNTINWILGHILASRNRLHQLLRLENAWSPELAHRYTGLDGAGWTPASAVELRTIASALARSQQHLMAAFDHLPPQTLAARANDGRTLAEVLGFFQFHEAYHTGQIALVRRIAGRPGVIKPPVSRQVLAPESL